MRRVGVGIDERDGDSFYPVAFESLCQLFQRSGVERFDLLALGIHSARHLKTARARHQRLVAPVLQRERHRPIATPDLQCVAKTACGQQRGLGTGALDKSIDHVRGAVLEEQGLIELHVGPFESV